MPDKLFKVDLRGVVDLLSHHLYSSPRVYLRELVQNATDAITARRLADPDAPRRVLVVPADAAPDGRLHCLDTGSGLSPEDVEHFLATIGSSSKRDELGLARQEFLGQFGIGLLSCFLVADEIELVTRAVAGGPTTRWVGRADGSYALTVFDAAAEDAERDAREQLLAATGAGSWTPAGEGGTWVRLRPRPGSSEWTSSGEVVAILRAYAEMLDVDVDVARPATSGGTAAPLRVTRPHRPWEDDTGAEALPVEALRVQAEELLGLPVLAVLPVASRQAALRGVVAVLGVPASPSSRQANRVYAKGMLVGDAVEGLLPDWAFFARALVDAGGLRLTASRESLYDDDLLAEVRSELGDQLRRWLVRLAQVSPVRFGEVMRLHEVGIRALAVHDDDLCRAYLPVLTVETTIGTLPFGELLRRVEVVRWAETIDDYRQVLPVAAAQGLAVVNAGYTLLPDLMARVHLVAPEVGVVRLEPGDLDAHVDPVPADVLAGYGRFLAVARERLAPLDVDVQVRRFRPSTLPALVLDDRDRASRRHDRSVVQASDPDDVWAGIVELLDDGGDAAIQLLLNHENAVVRTVAGLQDDDLLALAAESLWCQALLLGQRPLRTADQAVMSRSFLGLLERAVGAGRAPLDPEDTTGKDGAA